MRKYLFLFVMLSSNYISGFTQTSFETNATPVILRGTIIVPEGVIQHGYVVSKIVRLAVIQTVSEVTYRKKGIINF